MFNVTEYTDAHRGSSPTSSEFIETEEPPTLAALREASSIALAFLVLPGPDDVRTALGEMDLGDVSFHSALPDFSPPDTPDPIQSRKEQKQLLPLLTLALLSPHVGVCYASAELMRALTHSVRVLRTSVVDR